MSISLMDVPWLVYSVIGTTWLLSLWHFWLKPQLESKRPVADLPVPSHCHWLFGHLHFLQKPLQESYKDLFAASNDQGRIGFFMVSWRVMGVSHWSDVKRILYAEHQHKLLPIIKKHIVQFLGSHNIGMLNDRLWKHERSIVHKSLAAAIPRTESVVIQVAQSLVKSLERKVNESSEGVYISNALTLMKMATLDVFGKVAFSYNFACCEALEESTVAAAFAHLTRDLTHRVMTTPHHPANYFYSWPSVSNREHAKASKALRHFIVQQIEERTSSANNPKDLLTSLVEAHQNMSTEQPQNIPVDDLMSDVLLSLLFAGYDTTSIALTYVLYVTSEYPNVAEQCRQELQRVGQLDRTDDLVYCRAVLQEVLRLYPPAFTTQRWLQKPVVLPDGYTIPAQTLVIAPIWHIHRCEAHFERATEFRPDRWVYWCNDDRKWKPREYPEKKLPGVTHTIAPGNPNALFTFSAGARSCPGQTFAWTEALILMAHLLEHFEFSIVSDYVLEPDRNGVVQQPKGGLPLEIRVRSSS